MNITRHARERWIERVNPTAGSVVSSMGTVKVDVFSSANKRDLESSVNRAIKKGEEDGLKASVQFSTASASDADGGYRYVVYSAMVTFTRDTSM